MYNPVSTYRVQFNADCTFADFRSIVPYLQQLGVGTVYASPVFEAAPGSVHGYDGVNPNAINPEIGTEEELYDISRTLHDCGIGWLQDIVPNHMAFHSNNEWFMDVLEKGRQSEFASFFDVSWTGRLYHGRIMVPFLGSTLREVLQNNELSVVVHEGRFVLKYYDSLYPLRPASYATVLQYADVREPGVVSRLERIEDETDFAEQWEKLRNDAIALLTNHSPEKRLETINTHPDRLRHIVDEQFYRLCHWQETDRNINFRRFFTVNSLICLNIHRPEVFREYHRLIGELVEAHVFQGLRIDHIDGLYDPTNYLEQLRDLAGEETFVIVEKILEPGESLPDIWPVQGNTGYDFLAMVNNLFTDTNSEQLFSAFYQQFTGDRASLHDQLHDKKSYILYQHMGGELENLYQLFMRSELVEAQDYAQMRTEDIKTAIAEFLIYCPVYRYYGNHFPLAESEAGSVGDILTQIKQDRAHLAPAVGLLEKVLLEKPQEGNETYNMRVVRFYQRCMQFTGPLMAKGVEDTLMYTYNRFLAHNEVGDTPGVFGCSPEQFHAMMQERRQRWPLSLNATSTHDTKRGEDVRARLNVLSDLPHEWFARVEEWREINAALKKNGAPDANDEYFIYQTLLGAYPMPGTEDAIAERLQEYIEKALREAKTHSDWAAPDAEYEEAAQHFVRGLLDTQRPFWQSFSGFHREVADFGIVNSLSQLVLRFTCPGVPDTYQGTELWDLSLVDPDNRRSVDYTLRQTLLKEAAGTPLSALWNERYTGTIKLRLLHELMRRRREQPDLFAQGEYIPVQADGACGDHIFCFTRQHENHWLLVVLPLHIAQICREQNRDVATVDWKDTRIHLPEHAPVQWRNVWSGESIAGPMPAVAELFGVLPCAVLTGTE